MNPVFSTREFWQSYFTLEPKGVSEGDFARQLDSLSADFPVRDETIEFEYSGRQHTAVRRLVDFPFACGDRYSLLIEYVPSVDGCETNLFLVETPSGQKRQMGWCDLARWHPYCLRQVELDVLLQFWALRDPRWQTSELPLLLLCPFVGLANAGDLDGLRARTEAACRALGVPPMGEDQ
jgi:hypothetical protein